jgi:murein DD-endopeptidase MepM/ murein hydrolase activator NlpD
MGLTLSTVNDSEARRARTTHTHHPGLGLPEAIATLETLPQHLDRTEAWIGHVLGQLSDWAVWHGRQYARATVVLGTGWNTLLATVDPGGLLPRVDMSARQVLVCVPVEGEQTSEFGVRYHPILRRKKMHKGIDFGADRGSPVRAAGPGRVVYARRKGSYGRLVIIDHGLGVETRYAHLDRVHAVEGEFVSAEALIGRVGATGRATGPHLHFEVRQFGRAIDPRRAYTTPPTWPVAN